MTRAARFRWIAVQLLGFAVCVAALVWCVRAALSPGNREQLTRLWDAPLSSLAGLVGLTALSLLVNGVIFWATLLPVRRIPASDMIAVNALATFLAYLPFKASMIARAAIHKRRHGIPVTLVAGWFAAVAAVLLCTVAPLAAVSLWRGRIDWAWAAVGFGGTAVLAVVMAATARRIRAWLASPGGGKWRELLRGPMGNIAQAFTILSDARIVSATIGLRLVDTAGQAARFMLAAAVLGAPLPVEQAVIVSVSFFIIGIVSPAGMLGVREAGAAGLAGLLAITGSREFAAVSVLVGATEAVTNLGAAGLAVTWLLVSRAESRAGE
ncbi:MAG: flippase-like domain-containing protein [Phycisphaerales bacterium]|nr:flippase-like domain-containing protein [Phycisphaerales bacterium]